MFNINAFQNHLTEIEPMIVALSNPRNGFLEIKGMTSLLPNKAQAYITKDGRLRCFSFSGSEAKEFAEGSERYAALWTRNKISRGEK